MTRLAALLLALLSLGCAVTVELRRVPPPPPVPAERMLVPERRPSLYWREPWDSLGVWACPVPRDSWP